MNENIKNLLYELKGMLWTLAGIDAEGRNLNPFSNPLSDYAERIEEILDKEEKLEEVPRKDTASQIRKAISAAPWYHILDGELVSGAVQMDGLYKASDIWEILDRYTEEEE